MESEIKLQAIPGLLYQKKIRPKKKESVKITQVRGSMSKCKILTKLGDLEKKIEEKIKKRDAKAQSLVDVRKKFDLCKDVCVCTENECPMKDDKQCPVCFAVQKSACSKKPVVGRWVQTQNDSGKSSIDVNKSTRYETETSVRLR